MNVVLPRALSQWLASIATVAFVLVRPTSMVRGRIEQEEMRGFEV